MNLVIGNTSQLYHYFKEYDKDIVGVSSRDFNINQIKNNIFDRAFLLFAEQSVYSNNDLEYFKKINVDYTLNIIHQIKNFTKTIIVYSTCDVWDMCEGEIDINTPFNNRQTPYIKSKELLKQEIDKLRKTENIDVKIIYPFNFNSPYRKQGFLFSKFVELISKKSPIQVGNLNFYRDIIHPKIIVETSYNCTQDTIVGSGVLVNIRDFYKKILNHFNIDYNYYVLENSNLHVNTRKPYYLETNIKYTSLLKDTIYDIEQYQNTIS